MFCTKCEIHTRSSTHSEDFLDSYFAFSLGLFWIHWLQIQNIKNRLDGMIQISHKNAKFMLLCFYKTAKFVLLCIYKTLKETEFHITASWWHFKEEKVFFQTSSSALFNLHCCSIVPLAELNAAVNFISDNVKSCSIGCLSSIQEIVIL